VTSWPPVRERLLTGVWRYRYTGRDTGLRVRHRGQEIRAPFLVTPTSGTSGWKIDRLVLAIRGPRDVEGCSNDVTWSRLARRGLLAIRRLRILARPKATGIHLSELNISDRRQTKSRENEIRRDMQSESTRAVTGIAERTSRDIIPGHVWSPIVDCALRILDKLTYGADRTARHTAKAFKRHEKNVSQSRNDARPTRSIGTFYCRPCCIASLILWLVCDRACMPLLIGKRRASTLFILVRIDKWRDIHGAPRRMLEKRASSCLLPIGIGTGIGRWNKHCLSINAANSRRDARSRSTFDADIALYWLKPGYWLNWPNLPEP